MAGSASGPTLEMMVGRKVHSNLSVGLTYRCARRLTSVDLPDLTGPTTSMMNEPCRYSIDRRHRHCSPPAISSSSSRGA